MITDQQTRLLRLLHREKFLSAQEIKGELPETDPESVMQELLLLVDLNYVSQERPPSGQGSYYRITASGHKLLRRRNGRTIGFEIQQSSK
jgi:DNA-binding PadR family transcriptional regulator